MPLECVLVRNGQQAVVVNLDIKPAASPTRMEAASAGPGG